MVILRRSGHAWPLILAANRDEMIGQAVDDWYRHVTAASDAGHPGEPSATGSSAAQAEPGVLPVRPGEDPWTDEAGLISNLVASNGDAWLIGREHATAGNEGHGSDLATGHDVS